VPAMTPVCGGGGVGGVGVGGVGVGGGGGGDRRREKCKRYVRGRLVKFYSRGRGNEGTEEVRIGEGVIRGRIERKVRKGDMGSAGDDSVPQDGPQ
jgi:hypothetical protein